MNTVLTDRVSLQESVSDVCKRKVKVEGESKAGFFSAVLHKLKLWERNYRSRRQLLTLAPDQLKDIGLSRADALREGKLPFWK